jgi:hypothetical protein
MAVFDARRPEDFLPTAVVVVQVENYFRVGATISFNSRSNGFLVYVPRYALKGPVYLEQTNCGEEEVLYHDERLGGPMWTTGKLLEEGDQIHVEAEGRRLRQTYRLFDHVTVTIQLKVQHHGIIALPFWQQPKKEEFMQMR